LHGVNVGDRGYSIFYIILFYSMLMHHGVIFKLLTQCSLSIG